MQTTNIRTAKNLRPAAAAAKVLLLTEEETALVVTALEEYRDFSMEESQADPHSEFDRQEAASAADLLRKLRSEAYR